ncbi:hypothetical protein [Geminicoccus roseus]|uniref:hypothetical protein n=1 Tax=Geminicoccus roseus TaxID=404900 RepID=UPI0012F839D3|nr:hypothetical protein [Geminicoccus roseus]
MRSLVIVAGLWLTASAGASAAEVPELTGTWSGSGPAVSEGEGWETERSTNMSIDEQHGRVFRGVVKYEGGEEDFVGIIQADGKGILISNEDGHVTGMLTAADEMEVCYVEGGDDAIATCSTMKRAQ